MCLICLGAIKPTEAIWQCGSSCFAQFHLPCIQVCLSVHVYRVALNGFLVQHTSQNLESTAKLPTLAAARRHWSTCMAWSCLSVCAGLLWCITCRGACNAAGVVSHEPRHMTHCNSQHTHGAPRMHFSLGMLVCCCSSAF